MPLLGMVVERMKVIAFPLGFALGLRRYGYLRYGWMRRGGDAEECVRGWVQSRVLATQRCS